MTRGVYPRKLKTFLFCYGTLMRGRGNDRHLAGADFVGECRTAPMFTMVSVCDCYPAIVEGGATAIVGELYDVDDEVLARCDRLEGHPRFYERKRIRLSDGLEVSTYILPNAGDRTVIESGSWAEWLGSRSKGPWLDEDEEDEDE